MFKQFWHIYCWLILVFLVGFASSKDILNYENYYSNEFSKIISNDVRITVPTTATHYWNNYGLDDYEAIIKINYNSKDLIIKLKWKDRRDISDKLFVNYSLINGKLNAKNIRPYTISSNVKERAILNNLEIYYAVGEDYEIFEEINNTCLAEVFSEKLRRGIEPSDSSAECIIKLKKPVYRWEKFESFDFGSFNSFNFYDDIQISACGIISSPGTYSLTSDLTVTNGGNCISIGTNNVVLDGNNRWINSTTRSSGSGIRTYTSSAYNNNITIKNIKINNFYHGISLKSHNNFLENITVINSSYGIYFVYTSSPQVGASNTTIDNLYMVDTLIHTTLYNTRTHINNITTICVRDISGSNQYYYQANHSYIKNYNSDGCSLSIDDSYNITLENLTIRNIYYSGISYLSSDIGKENYVRNVVINGTKATSYTTEPAIKIISAKNNIRFYNVSIYNIRNNSGILTLPWSDGYKINVTFENLVIQNTTNRSINQLSVGNANPNITIEIINGTYQDENLVFSNSYLYRKWKYKATLNETCNLTDARVWAENWKINETILNSDFDFIDPLAWDYDGDVHIEESYFYVYDLESGGERPHRGGWISPKNVSFEKDKKYSLIIADIDNYFSDVNFTISVCGLNFTYPKRYYGAVELSFMCVENGILNISIPGDNIGYLGYYFSGITDYLFVFGWDKYTEHENYTVNGEATLYLTQYVNNMNDRYFLDNYTVYIYNASYTYIENITTNKEKKLDVYCLYNICWNHTDWGIFIPRGCVFKVKKGNIIFVKANAMQPLSFNLTSLSYRGVNLNLSSRDSLGVDIWFSENGSYLYFLGYNTKRIYQYFMQVPFNITNATYLGKNFSVNSQDSGPTDVQVAKNGEKMYMLGLNNDRLYEYDLAVPYDISTSVYTGRSYFIRGYDNYPNGFYIDEDRQELYLIGTANDTVYKFKLVIPYNISSLVYAEKSFSITSIDNLPNDVFVSKDGKKLYIVGDTNNRVYEFNMQLPYNLTNLSYNNVYLNVGSQESIPETVFVNFNLKKLWVLGDQRETIYEYSQ